MVSMASFWLLSLLLLCTPLAQRFRVAQLAAFGASLCCWTYALLTGMAPPALRAAVMTTAAMGAVAMGRPNDAWRGIVFAAAILTTWRPELIWTAGFHLSFSAVIALHGHGGRRESKEQDAESTGPPGLAVRCWHRSRQIVGASTVAALATAPWVAHHFGQVSLMGVVANALAVPVVGALLLPGVFLAAIASVIPLPGRGYFFLAVDGGVTFFLDAMGWLARCSWSSQTVPRPNLWEAGLLCVALLLVSGAGRYRFNWAAALAVALVAVVSWIWRTHAPQWTQSLRVTFLDIGAGDATLVQFPTGQAMLVDAGPSFGDLKGPPLVVALVQRAGTMPLDLLALTHRHNDHVAGLGAMSTQVGFPHLWLPFAEEWSLPRPVGFGRRLLQPLPVAPRCGTVRWGEVTVQVLHPCSDEDRRLSENDRSLVLRLAWRGVAFLLPGDIEEETEAILLRRGVPLQATVLKLPHHGSDTSTSAAFLAAVSPALAIASCRAGGRNPLPHSAVHRRVVRSGAVLLSTAEVGAVRVTTTGQTVAVATARDGLIFRELSGVVPYEDSGATGPAAPLHRVSSE
jgi:competence protein ComEC